jgi:hypothetical protein
MYSSRTTTHADIAIIVFEGVIGNVYKKNMIEDTFPNLYMRPDVVDGLLKVQERLGIILVTQLEHGPLQRVLRILNTNGVHPIA